MIPAERLPPPMLASVGAAGGSVDSGTTTGAAGGSNTSSGSVRTAITSSASGGLWGSSAVPSAPLFGTQRTLLHAKKERLSRGARLLLPNWAARQIVINPVMELDTGSPSLSGHYATHMRFSRFLYYIWHFLSRPSNLWLIVIYSISLFVYTPEDRSLGSLPHQVLLLMGAPLLLFLSVAVFAGNSVQTSSRREAIERSVSRAFTCRVLDGREPALKEVPWGSLRPGNIVRVYEGECVPADLLILNCGHSASAILDLRMVDSAASFTRRYCVRDTKADYSLTALAGLRGRVVCEGPAYDSPHFKATIRFDARPRGTRVVPNNFAPRGSILRWTEWIDGVVLYAAEDVAYLQPPSNWKKRGRELDAACVNLVGCSAVLTLLLGVALFLTKGLVETDNGWMFDVPQYRLQLARCLLLLSCGPVALFFAVDILKLRRRENLLRPPHSMPTCGKGIATGGGHSHSHVKQGDGLGVAQTGSGSENSGRTCISCMIKSAALLRCMDSWCPRQPLMILPEQTFCCSIREQLSTAPHCIYMGYAQVASVLPVTVQRWKYIQTGLPGRGTLARLPGVLHCKRVHLPCGINRQPSEAPAAEY